MKILSKRHPAKTKVIKKIVMPVVAGKFPPLSINYFQPEEIPAINANDDFWKWTSEVDFRSIQTQTRIKHITEFKFSVDEADEETMEALIKAAQERFISQSYAMSYIVDPSRVDIETLSNVYNLNPVKIYTCS